MSTLKDNTLQYKTAIKNNFDSFNPTNKGVIEVDKLSSFISSINTKNSNPFLYDSIKSLAEENKNKEGISSEEYISYIDTKLSDTDTNEGLKNIFNVFCNSSTGNISWNTFPLIAEELGDNEMAEKLLNVIRQSKVYTKDLNFKEFIDIMNNEYENDMTTTNNIDITDNSENINGSNISNIKINEYIVDYEEKPTYKQRKMMQKKENESDEKTYSSKNSYQDNEDIIVEEKYYNNNGRVEENNEINEGNDKSNKRYHRRYRSKKVKSNHNMLNDNSDNGKGNTHKSYTKYRKNHTNY